MSSLLNLGTRTLLANQMALQTTGHNIANASTVGYSRQSAVMQQVEGQYTGGGYVGKGVQVLTVERAHNEFVTRQAALARSVQAMDATRADRLAALEDILQGGTSGLGASVNDLVNAFSDIASTPTDVTARNVVLARAQEMSARFRNAQAQIDDLQHGVNGQLDDAVTQINSLAARIAELNGQVQRAQGGGQQPNDLLDQRDELVRQLNGQVQASTVAGDDGSLNIFVGSQALVLGSSVAQVALQGAADGTRALTITRGAVTQELDESSLGGGAVAGLLRFQNGDLAAARDGLGRMALAITSAINTQHRLGVDLNGQPGSDFFTPIAIPDALPAPWNTGTATVSAEVADPTALVASSYQVVFGSSGSIAVQRLSDGKTTTFTGPMPIEIDGLRLDLSGGSAAAGSSFTLRPYARAADGTATALSSPREIAAASPVEARASSSNRGTVAVAGVSASQAHASLGATVTLTFTSAGTFDVAGSGTGDPSGIAYTAGQPISFNGWTLTLSGNPQAGDTITVQAASASYSQLNAGNASALLGLRDVAMFDGATLADGYASLMAEMGVRSQSAQYAASISGSIATSLESERANISGVNLDEEAARLLQYQQAYQASAKMIQIAQSIFDSLLQGMP
ncbi:flagellar hook-associated protein FlgK [Xenophilus arseniciresistens]|uniref:Flagellar hook-associated protein 1 n=1 Tax=Xenophilus arseniciresistens TaxID=1283306 RepID=A0AAE3N8K7_9BURK|nr:flagellar hook-associated protein FlgK [Xenophilus arseniciresistens]MDA7415259.1 flagellar hook-associated protein FlgK [Xenophilus arseniciresistens]